MVGWHHQLGHDFEQVLRVGDRQGSLVSCSPYGRKGWTWLSNCTGLPYSQSYDFDSNVQMWELDHSEDWAAKNRYFQIVLLEKMLDSPLYWKEINQSFLKEINWAYSLEGLLLKLKLMQRANSLGKTLVLRKIEGKKWSVQKRMSWSDSIIDSMGMDLSKLWERMKDMESWSMGSQRVRPDLVTEQWQE